MKRCVKCFTLIELLVVVAIIGILLSLLMPSLSNARIAGKTAVSISNLKQIYTGSILYADSYSGYLFLSADNPHSSNDEGVNWTRMLYENLKGEKFSDTNSAKDEMADDKAYMGMMFCPVIRQYRGGLNQHGKGRSDYSMNRHFAPANRSISQLTEGKDEPFFTPGTPMPSTQAASTLKYGTYDPGSLAHPSYQYLQVKTLGLYIDGHVSTFNVARGAEIDADITNRNDFK